MSLPDTGDLSRKWCPKCEPDADPSREILSVQYCAMHPIDRKGADDVVITESNLTSQSGTAESEGHTNKLVSDLLKKGRKKKT
jgi:hypothetical protein